MRLERANEPLVFSLVGSLTRVCVEFFGRDSEQRKGPLEGAFSVVLVKLDSRPRSVGKEKEEGKCATGMHACSVQLGILIVK